MIAAAIDLGDGLAQIATALRVPVLIAAIVVLLLCALELGRFGAEYWRRRVRMRDFDLRQLAAQAIADPQHAAHYASFAPSPIAAEAVLQIAAAAQGAGGPRPASTPSPATSWGCSDGSTAPACSSAQGPRSG